MPLRSSPPNPDQRTRWQRLLRPTWEERKRLAYFEAWSAIVVSYMVVAFAYLFPQDFRNSSQLYVATAWLSFLCRAFLFHLGIILVLIPLLMMTTGPSLWTWWPKPIVRSHGETVSIMSVNLLMANTETQPIIEEIKQAAPDVLMFQEYTEHWHKALQQSIGTLFPYTVFVKREDSFGGAIYSRRPFVGRATTSVRLGDATEPQFRAVIQLDGRDVALYNVHLLPPRRLDYVTVGRLQFADLIDHLTKEKLPAIVAGDFNFTDCSPQAESMTNAGLTDAYSVGGWGRGATWPVLGYLRWLPGLRLDHIYLSNALTCIESRTGEGRGSDHRPILAKIAFKAERQK